MPATTATGTISIAGAPASTSIRIAGPCANIAGCRRGAGSPLGWGGPPSVPNLFLPPLIFLLLYRTPFDTPRGWRRERRSILATNLALGALAIAAGALLGFGRVALVELTILMLASIGGVWLFALQHKFEGAQWARQPDWSFATASLAGTSCLRLPAVLQWFTGNIRFHHIHHLNPRVPNYRLQAASDALPALRPATTLSLLGGLNALRYVLWDEDQAKLVRFRDVRRPDASA